MPLMPPKRPPLDVALDAVLEDLEAATGKKHLFLGVRAQLVADPPPELAERPFVWVAACMRLEDGQQFPGEQAATPGGAVALAAAAVISPPKIVGAIALPGGGEKLVTAQVPDPATSSDRRLS